jgi:hypothetical protein
MRRNKIQSFISNLKQAKEPPKELGKELSSISLVSLPGPPSYCSAEAQSPIPFPQQPLNRHPERLTTRSESRERSSMKKNIPRDPGRRHKDSPKEETKLIEGALAMKSVRGRETKNETHERLSRSPIRTKSAPRSSVIRTRQTRPSPQPSEVTPIVRKEKMRSLEEAAKARVQSKKDQENELRRFDISHSSLRPLFCLYSQIKRIGRRAKVSTRNGRVQVYSHLSASLLPLSPFNCSQTPFGNSKEILELNTTFENQARERPRYSQRKAGT